ncbi:MAG TPA: type II toxin-antitoxin system Phd/YefM family antitoxin [Phycisphaerae bacterium]|nr:type II toxin-antitoxin system Phd/YefM family antitoxin [Phycisphaerae bacterium]
MLAPDDIRPLSDFQRNARSHIRRLSKTGKPEVLTVNGRASIVIQDAAAYGKLLDELEAARLGAALEAAERGEGLPVKEAFAMARRQTVRRRKR